MFDRPAGGHIGCPPSYPGTGGTATRTGPITSGIAGKCIDVANSSAPNDAHVQIFTCNKTPAQQWTLPN